MSVYFIGAGPGAADLITVRALERIRRCRVCIYAGSLVPADIVAQAPRGAVVLNSADMVLDEIIAHIRQADDDGHDVARVHSGDPSLYGAIAEQIARLRDLQIAYEIIPGVPAYAAMAAKMGNELTLAGVSQSIVLTRTAVRASAMPDGETLENFAKTGAVLAIHLSINNLHRIVRVLSPYYGDDCPIAVGYRVSWPDEKILFGTLGDIRACVKSAGITRTALIIVGRTVRPDRVDFRNSALYDPAHTHILRR